MTAQGVDFEPVSGTLEEPVQGRLASLVRGINLQLAISVVFWGATLLYAVVFSALSLDEYHAFVSHALDLGNMTQAFWNTVHGHPFEFENMRAAIDVEAFGTTTRLSFHVEPIIPFLAIIYFFWQHVETLLIMQTLALASGTIPIRLLVRRHLGPGLGELAYPIAYLLFPALQATNLYEFHPVSFAAPLLLWAFYFADGRRYSWFALFAIAAMGTKEELGLLVALIGIWIALRHGERRFGLVIAILSVLWSLLAVFAIVPHFQTGKPSSYWARYLPPGWPYTRYPVGVSQVTDFWFHHFNLVWADLTSEAKLSYLHRLLMPVGYTALLSPLTILIALPSLALILLSYEPHMYGGLAHYSTELVPIMVVSGILGVGWLGRFLAKHLPIRAEWVYTASAVYVLVAAFANQHVNGLSPLADSYVVPAVTAHDRIIDQALTLIPPTASVSAQDLLNPHVSDRAHVYLFPDTDYGRVDYILVDATQSVGSTMRICDLAGLVTGRGASCALVAGPGAPAPLGSRGINVNGLLPSQRWNVAFADDGVLLLKRRLPGQALHNTLPPAFFSFVEQPEHTVPPHRLVARLGPYLELEGYSVERREVTNLRNPDVVLLTWWHVLKTPPANARLMHYLSDPTGALQVFSDDQQATDWLPLSTWKPGHTYEVRSAQLTVTTNQSGPIDIDIGLSTNPMQYQIISNNVPVHVIVGAPGAAAVGRANGQNRILRVASVHAQL
jgi:uncharacterized membrane protein